jgi:hypothetical protein
VTTRRTIEVVAAMVLAGALARSATGEGRYPAVDGYLMPRDAEVALARSAAPSRLSDRATVKVLTKTGFVVASEGDNGMVCLVMRGFSAPTYTPAMFRDVVYDASVRAPICFAAPAAKTVLPYYELRTTLGLAGKTPDQIAAAVEQAYKAGQLPKRTETTFAYMFSAHQHLGAAVGVWHPHMMVFTPNAGRATLGEIGGDASPVPQVSDDAGTPFAVIVVPVGDAMFIHQPSPSKSQ